LTGRGWDSDENYGKWRYLCAAWDLGRRNRKIFSAFQSVPSE
jgi:hypothetical protein